MYSSPEIVLKYLSHLMLSKNGKGHGMHSPFIFEFITKVLQDKTKYSEYEVVGNLRRMMERDHRTIAVQDFGTGVSSKRSIASIARRSVKSKKWAQLLFRIARFYKPPTVIELGTSLGITTSYLSLANPAAKIFSLEGAASVAECARNNFALLDLKNVKLIEGNFDNTLPAVLYQVPAVDLVFIDGNHTRQPTENYFHWLLSKVHNDSILIFDDIHWSREMEEAWENICSHLAVRCSIDLFFFGILFFRQEFRQRQHFKIRF